MGCCPQCGGINTLDNIDGKALACRECGWTRRQGLDRWLTGGRPRTDPPGGPLPPALPLLASLQRTTPGGDEGRAEPVCPPWTRDPAERGGPRTGGPTTPPRPQPLPAGIPRRRKPFGAVPAAALALCLVLPLLPASSASSLPRPLALSANGPTLQVFLSFHNSSSNSTVPVPQAIADFLFINSSDLEPVENFSLENGENYTFSDFPGLDLTNITTVLVDAQPPVEFPNATSVQLDLENVSNQTDILLDLVWTSQGVSRVPPPINGSFAPPPPAFPLFLQLVGVGLFLAFSSLIAAGLWKIVSLDREEDSP